MVAPGKNVGGATAAKVSTNNEQRILTGKTYCIAEEDRKKVINILKGPAVHRIFGADGDLVKF